MKDFEEMNQRFRTLLRSIEINNNVYFPQPGSIFDTYTIVQLKGSYTIKIIASIPESVTVQIETAFLQASANE